MSRGLGPGDGTDVALQTSIFHPARALPARTAAPPSRLFVRRGPKPPAKGAFPAQSNPPPRITLDQNPGPKAHATGPPLSRAAPARAARPAPVGPRPAPRRIAAAAAAAAAVVATTTDQSSRRRLERRCGRSLGPAPSSARRGRSLGTAPISARRAPPPRAATIRRDLAGGRSHSPRTYARRLPPHTPGRRGVRATKAHGARAPALTFDSGLRPAA